MHTSGTSGQNLYVELLLRWDRRDAVVHKREGEEEREEERAAKQQKTIVINQYGELIGELTSLERAIYQHGCSTCDPHTAGCCSGCVSLRKKGLLE